MMNAELSQTDKALIRTAAAFSRKLDLNMSALQAIDTLQQLRAKFPEHWSPLSPWLVLSDSYTLPVEMPVPKMLKEIEKHGQPVGIAGVAFLTTRRVSVFQMPFFKDQKSRRIVEDSAKEAHRVAVAALNASFDETIRSKEMQDAMKRVHTEVQDDHDD